MVFAGNQALDKISGCGGAIRNDGNLGLSGNVRFERNSAGQDGGAIVMALEASMVVSCCVNFSSNTADRLGGAIAVSDSSSLSLCDALLSNNSAGFYG